MIRISSLFLSKKILYRITSIFDKLQKNFAWKFYYLNREEINLKKIYGSFSSGVFPEQNDFYF